ncbi:MAG TPA: glycosyltransferase [Rhodospirillales bacterium]|nr:glycosyltransferase [Rhodospirillales bacterium]
MPEENNPPDPLLAVVVPVHNEVDNVVPLIDEIMAAMQGVCEFEIIYVDDGSIDGTMEILSQAAANNSRLRILAHRQCYGQSAAIGSGVDAARAPLIATLDGDGQNDPADIPALLRAYNDTSDAAEMMITGLRAKRRDSWIKRISSKIANGVRAGLLKDDTPDTGCGLKVFSRAAFVDLPRFDHMHRFLPALMIRNGGKVVSVPVNHRPRQRGASKYGTLDRLFVGISDLIGVMWLQRRAKRPVVDEVSPK